MEKRQLAPAFAEVIKERTGLIFVTGGTGSGKTTTLAALLNEINRLLGMFNRDEEQQVRDRLAGSLRYVVSQRLVPRKAGGRLLVTELLGSNLRSREAIALGESENRRFGEIIEAGGTLGWHSFEQSLAKAFEDGLITEETALHYSVNQQVMHQRVDAIKKRYNSPENHGLKMVATGKR